MATIVPPNDFAYSSYVTNRDLRDFSVIGFFEFQDFPSVSRQLTSKAWSEVVALVEKQHPKISRGLRHEWDATKHERKSYWIKKERIEKQVRHLEVMEDYARHQTIVAARKVDFDTEELVKNITAGKQSSSGKASVSPFVPTSVHPAGAKRKNIDADEVHHAREKTLKPPAGQKAQPVASEEPSISDSPSELLENISHFVAMNYILTTADELEGFSTEVLEDIRRRFVWNATRLDDSIVEMCGFLEVKPPGSCHTVREYLHDYWNLANCAKDATDNFLQQGLPIPRWLRSNSS
ncbi:hypothetical protein BGZ95_010781, partial [Linnemannia exigua]